MINFGWEHPLIIIFQSQKMQNNINYINFKILHFISFYFLDHYIYKINNKIK